jgi:hypothetical protein
MRVNSQLLCVVLVLSLSCVLVACEATDAGEGISNGDSTIGANLDGAGSGGVDAGPVIVNCTEHADCAGVAAAGSCDLGMCDKANGVCITTPMPDDSKCTNAGDCWAEGLCAAGVCKGTVPSDEGTTCETTGVCGGGGMCMDGECIADGSQNSCDDGDPCSIDICSEEAGGCVYQSEADGTECTTECIPEGVCSSGSCQGDEIPDCEETTEPGCGDGKCGPGENPKTCPQDCDNTIVDPMTCLGEHCGDLLAACEGAPACFSIIGCMQGCDLDTEEECLEECVSEDDPDAQSMFWETYDCGEKHDCFGGEPDSCGNGKCEPGENPDNCFQDCSDAPPGPGPCLEAQCGPESSACQGDAACAGIIACMNGCQSEECQYTCILDAGEQGANKFIAMIECGDVHGCFEGGGGGEPECGNGVCEQGESGFNCPEDCKGGEDQCGNGKCESSEDPNNCPEDCGQGGGDDPVVECLQDECGGSFSACFSDEDCTELVNCLQQCESQQCEEQCYQKSSQSGVNMFIELIQCGQENQCFEDDGGSGEPTDPGSPSDDPVQQCLEEECGSEYQTCLNDDGCTEILVCLEQCEDGDQQCENGCMFGGGNGFGGNDEFWALAECAGDEGCLEAGDGNGGNGGNGGGGGGDPECGDGVCEGFEQFFCPEDC